MTSGSSAPLPPRTSVDLVAGSNLTGAQFLLWMGQQLDPDVPLYDMIQTFRIEGDVDPEAFSRAWQAVVASSDALRSTIHVDQRGVPMRVVGDAVGSRLEVVDLRGHADGEQAAREWIDRRKTRRLVLDDCLYDCALLLIADDVTVWYLCMHHMVTDGQAFALIYQAMARRYADERTGQAGGLLALPQYADYVAYEREFRANKKFQRSADYWRALLAAPVPPTEFFGRTLSHASTATDRLVVELDARRSARLRELAASPAFASLSQELSLSSMWTTIVVAMLQRNTGRATVRVGSPFLGRPAGFRDTIGLFVESGILQVDIADDDTFESLCASVMRATINGIRHATPGAGSAEVNRSYDVVVNYVTSRFDHFAGHHVTTEWVHSGHADRDHALRVQVSDFDARGNFRVHIDVNAELFGDNERRWLLDQFNAVIDALLAEPSQSVHDVALLRDDERQRLLVDFNDTDAAYPPELSVVSLFDSQVERTPDHIAAEDATRQVTYRELAAQSCAVADALAAAGVGTGDLVAVCARRSIDVVAGILGILRLGAAYVPIDPAYPAERRRFMIADASPAAVVTAGASIDDLLLDAVPVLDLSQIRPTPSTHLPMIDHVTDPHSLAYMIYTSGSTGTPKGTELTHRGLVNYITWAQRTYGPGRPLDFPLYSSLSFDLTITSLFVPLISGGRIVVYDRPGEREGLEIVDVMQADCVDIVKLTPAHIALLIELGVQCRRISGLIVGGENFRTDLALAVQQLFPNGVEIYNEYGPTEAVVGCMVHRFDSATDVGPSVPIGVPAANSRIYVLDRRDQPVPPGVIGEMIISSDGVARGYRNRPELTAARFGDDPFRPGARWYRTGDLARWGADGRLEFLGRNDHQVKIRGARIEIGEIESAVLGFAGIGSAVVDVIATSEPGRPAADTRDDRRLVAYYTGSTTVAVAELRQHLAELLPEFMVPSYLVQLDELPLTVNGKVDRAALPDPRELPQHDQAHHELAYGARDQAAPRSDAERVLAEVWADALHLSAVGIDDNFFDLGGNSITTIQIVAAARQRGWQLTPRDVFQHQTVAELALVARQLADDSPSVDRGAAFHISDAGMPLIRSQLDPIGGLAAIDDIYPLTPTQLGMLYHTLTTSSRSYFGQGTCVLSGEIDTMLLRAAWDAVCDRHPGLRARFLWTGLETPMQVVLRDVRVPFTEHDWRGQPVDACATKLHALLARQRNNGFDLAAGNLLMDVTLVRTDVGSHLIWNCHHILLDGWSARLVFDEVLDTYEHLLGGRQVEQRSVPPFRDHVQWLSGQDPEAALAWWRAQLQGVDQTTAIPFDTRAQSTDPTQEPVSRALSAELSAMIDQFCREQRTTLSSVATAAWALVLGQLGRVDDVVFGTTVSGREHSVPDAEAMIGMFITTLPTRVSIAGQSSVGEWVRSLQAEAIEARRHGHLALSEVQRCTDVPSSQPLFDSIVVVENHPSTQSVADHPLQPGQLEIWTPSNFPLAILIHPGAPHVLEGVHDVLRFASPDVARLLGYLEHAIAELCRDADRPVVALDVVPPAEVDELRRRSLGTVRPRATTLVHDWIERHAADTPDRPAVVDARGALSYRQLDERSRAMATVLRSRGVQRGDRVGLVIGTTADHVAALLGIMQLGAAYVPFDRSIPAARLASIIEQAGLRAIVADRTFVARVDATVELVDLAEIDTLGAPSDLAEIDTLGAPRGGDIAYVIYTSGSTGTPKGVAVTHANLAHSTVMRAGVYEEPPGSFLLLSSLAFDSSMVGVFWTLEAGGTLVMADDEQRQQLRAIGELVQRHQVSHLLALPSLYDSLMAEHQPGQLDSLRTVIVAGEACAPTLPALHARHCPQATLHNEYGPTEATVWSHAHLVTAVDDTSVPIGQPMPNSAGVVVDLHGRLAPVGIAGELLIGGDGVAAGYLGRPDLTATAFVTLPSLSDLSPRWYRTGDLVRWDAHGRLEFVGRIDDQVKIRGYRIELSEIDAALLEAPGVRVAATVVLATPDGDRRQLVGCYSGADVDQVALRAHLSARLPAYMVPTLLHVADMPTTTTGKVDRRALERLAGQRVQREVTGYRQPRNDLERTLLAIWSSVLGRDDISVHDNFFDLGGNSLDAMRLFARIERTTGRELLLSSLFEAPTVATFAAMVEQQTPTPTHTSLVPIKTSGFKRPFFLVAPYEVSVLELGKIGRHFDTDRPLIGLQPAGLLAGEVVHHSIEEMAQHYTAAIRSMQPQGPYLIGGHCDGAWVAHEMAKQLVDSGEVVRSLAMVDIPPPNEQRPSTPSAKRLVDRLRYYSRDGRLLYAVRWQLRLRLDKWLLLRFGSKSSRRVRDVRIAHADAFARYHLEHDPRSPVHLIRSTELAVLMDEIAWYEGFRDPLREVVVTDIPSIHANLLREPDTIELAAVIGRRLDEVDMIDIVRAPTIS